MYIFTEKYSKKSFSIFRFSSAQRLAISTRSKVPCGSILLPIPSGSAVIPATTSTAAPFYPRFITIPGHVSDSVTIITQHLGISAIFVRTFFRQVSGLPAIVTFKSARFVRTLAGKVSSLSAVVTGQSGRLFMLFRIRTFPGKVSGLSAIEAISRITRLSRFVRTLAGHVSDFPAPVTLSRTQVHFGFFAPKFRFFFIFVFIKIFALFFIGFLAIFEML